MIGSTDLPNWGTLFAGALVALVISICCRTFFWCSPKKRVSTPKRLLTLRIDEIPIDTSSAALEHDLRSFVNQHLGLKEDCIIITLHSLFRRDQKIACATATFHTSFSAKELIRKLDQAKAGLPYRFDANFYGITPLYEAQGGGDVDIIAVPGLGSHAIGSWKSPSSNDLWLRDYLPNDVPNIRVLLYGYDTSVPDSDSKVSIEDLGSGFLESIKAFRANTPDLRPIIFIGHSLGGLLVKEALVHACRNSNDQQNINLRNACYGMLLFGVPNLGLRNEQLKSIVEGQPNEVLIRDLVVDNDSEPSPFLKRISDEFSRCCKGQYQVISFFERKSSPTVEIQQDRTLTKTGPKIFMVTQKSATSTGLTAAADENNVPLNTDHSGLVKYNSRTQDEYSVVKGKIETLVANANREVDRRFANNNSTPEQERLWNNLNQPPYTSFRNSARLSKPEEGTLEWLVQGEDVDHEPEIQIENTSQESLCAQDFILWKNSRKSERLLVTAPPGRGKSVLSNFVLGHLENEQLVSSRKIIYYFCNIKNDEASRNANAILRALIVQLCERQQRLFQILPSDYEKQDRFSSASFDTLWHIFEQMLRNDTYAQIYCVIDGLDVYEEGMGELISNLVKFRPKSAEERTVLKLFCTSRPQHDVLELWRSSVSKILRCNPDDLKVFIESRVKSLGKSFTDNMRQTIESRLREQADNTFLWLEVVLRKIASSRLPTLSKIEKTIKDSPQDLDSLYKMLVKDLVEKDGDSARLLAWVVYARHPLDLETLGDAIAIDPTKTYTSYEQFLEDRPSLESEEIHKGFGTLLDVVEGKVYLIHQSVKDYFQRENPLSAFLDIEPRLLLAHVCMAYLSLDEFDCSPWESEMLLQDHPLFGYASRYWYSHIKTSEDFNSRPSLRQLLTVIISPSSRKAEAWIRANMRDNFLLSDRHSSHPIQKSRIATFFGIGWLAELLLNEGSLDLEDDSKGSYFLEDAAKSPNEAVLKVLLHHEKGMELVVTSTVVEKIAKRFDEEIMTLLLDRRGVDVLITKEVVKAAASNSYGKGVMTVLLDRRGADVIITEEVVKAAAGNYYNGKEVMTLLLDRRGADVLITEEVVKAAAGNYDSKEVIALLLDRRGADVLITEEVVKAAAGNLNGKEVMTLLLDQRGADVLITEEVVKAAAGNHNNGEEVMTLLLDRRGADVLITEEVVKAAAGNHNNGEEVMTLLLDRRGADVLITEEVVKAAAGNYYNGKEVMTLLLDRRGADVLITEEVVKAAAGNYYDSKEVMTLLLDRRGADVLITEEVVKAAAGNHNGKEVIALLLDRRGADVLITEEVVKAAAGNYNGKEVITLLLNQSRADFLIAKGAVAAVAECFNKEVMTLLLDQHGADVLITKEVVKAAAGNYYNGEEVMTVLLDRRGADVLITEEVVKAAAGNHNNGEEVMTLLLDRRGADVLITEEVVKAAAGNYYNGKEVMTLLLDRRGADVSITEEVVKAAAGNYFHSKDVMTLLLDRCGADVLITEEVVKAAVRNKEPSKEMLRLLLKLAWS